MRVIAREQPNAHALCSGRTVIRAPVNTDTAYSELQSGGYVSASSFTPINRPARQILTPQSLTFTSSTEPSPQANRGRQRGKRHHPAVANYLGLGVEAEPPHLESYAPALPPTPSTPPRSLKRKYSRKKQHGDEAANDETENARPAKHRRVSDGLRVTRPGTRRTVKMTDTTTFSGSAPSAEVSSSPSASRNSDIPALARAFPYATETSRRGKRSCNSSKAACNKATVSSTTAQNRSVACGSKGHHLSDLDSQDTMADDEIDDIFNMIDLSNANDAYTTKVTSQTAGPTRPHHARAKVDTYYHLNPSEDDFGDEDLFSLTAAMTNITSSPLQPTSASAKAVGIRSPCAMLSVGLTQESLPSTSRPRSRKFVSPTPSNAKALIQKKPAASSYEERKPIVRPPFPAPVRDRSPIIGLSPTLLLRTCFRVGEAINQANYAAKHGQQIVLELYARVLSSQRNEVKQDFVFRDLFHDKPPYIKGVYNAAIWKSVKLYDYDSERLLEERRICRCIGTVKREGKEWVMMVLNAWEATWDDINWAEGIVKV